MPDAPASRWDDAVTAARLVVASLGDGGHGPGGIRVRARAGDVRDAWICALRAILPASAPVIRITPATPVDMLDGCVDLAASLAAGRLVTERGILDRAAGGVIVLAMAERCEAALAHALARALDGAGIVSGNDQQMSRQPFALIALDEGVEPDETVPAMLRDRLALTIDLEGVSAREACAPGPAACEASPAAPVPELDDDLAQIVAGIGMLSLRPALAVSGMSRRLARMESVAKVRPDHVATALRLVLGFAPSLPDEMQQGEADAPPPDSAPEASDASDPQDIDPAALRDMIVEAARAGKLDLPSLSSPRGSRTAPGAAGKSGVERSKARRGRPVGVMARPPAPGARPDVVATLLAAAPWQLIRARMSADQAEVRLPARPIVRTSDFRWRRLKHPAESAAIFAVDASGSTALERLAEAKGAIERILADCYSQRDHVALIAFRGAEAEILLEPTRSLVRAKRSLSALPGGGATPLADGLRKSLDMAIRVRRKGQSPLVVVMTDGSGNMALDGTASRDRAREDCDRIARHFRAEVVPSVIVDIARRPRDTARALAARMQGDYRALPSADAAALSDVVTSYLRA